MIKEKVLYSLGDITIVPSAVSKIRHRSECNVFYKNDFRQNSKNNQGEYLPIFVSPMASVINEHNIHIWNDNNLIPIVPRTVELNKRIDYAYSDVWAAFGLDEFAKYFCDKEYVLSKNMHQNMRIRALIDIANGHIKYMQDIITEAKHLAKELQYDIEIMAGNVANPETYKLLSEAGADYVRCAVGTGGCCITSSNTATHYAMASLLDVCKQLKTQYHLHAAIIADGGINSYSNAIKALALGADYVMIGTTFAKCFESAGEFIKYEKPSKDYTAYSLYDLNTMRWNSELSESEKKDVIKAYAPLCKTVFGMSTRKAQTMIALAQGKKKEDIKTKTSEGIEKEITVDYTVAQWTENFIDYLRSTMSYCNFTEILDFVGGPDIMLLSESAKQSINK